MNCFQIIKTVLDEAYEEIEGEEKEKDKRIEGELNELMRKYARLSEYANQSEDLSINYRDPVTRFAYIYKYVTSHANLVYSIAEKSKELVTLFDRDKVNVSCIGGGPGSEFLGILKYLMVKQKRPTVKFKLCDREKAWEESWSDVDDKIDPDFRISTSYLTLDVTDTNDWKPHTKYYQSDLFTMVYFMSEVISQRYYAGDYFTSLFEGAKQGSLFLFVDNNAFDQYEWFDELAKKHGIKILRKDECRMVAPSDEDKAGLGEYSKKFNHTPKVQANIAYRIGQKA